MSQIEIEPNDESGEPQIVDVLTRQEETQGEVDLVLKKADELGNDWVYVQALNDNTEQLLASGDEAGFDQTSVEIASAALESLCTRYGIASVSRKFAKEDFTSRLSRRRETNLAQESLREVGKVLWKKMVEMIERMQELFQNFIEWMKSKLSREEAQMEAAEELIDEVTTKTKQASETDPVDKMEAAAQDQEMVRLARIFFQSASAGRRLSIITPSAAVSEVENDLTTLHSESAIVIGAITEELRAIRTVVAVPVGVGDTKVQGLIDRAFDLEQSIREHDVYLHIGGRALRVGYGVELFETGERPDTDFNQSNRLQYLGRQQIDNMMALVRKQTERSQEVFGRHVAALEECKRLKSELKRSSDENLTEDQRQKILNLLMPVHSALLKITKVERYGAALRRHAIDWVHASIPIAYSGS